MNIKKGLWFMVNSKWFIKLTFKRRFQDWTQWVKKLPLTINYQPSTTNHRGFTLLETLIATGIASVIITSALSIVASIYFSQRKVQFSHDFFSESRFLMERIAQTTRNNTIDYDRYFVEYGPSSGDCSAFVVGANGQVPDGHIDSGNDQENRNILGYSTIFYWDTNGDAIPDRNLGGVNLTGSTVDGCTKAWDESVEIRRLFLINSARTVRTAINHLDDGADLKVSMSRMLAVDADKDGTADAWGPFDADDDGNYEAGDGDIEVLWTGSECQIKYDADGDNTYANPAEYYAVMGDSTSEEWCDQAHREQDISPVALQVNDLQFQPNPVFDPYLAFRNDNAQVHPQVFITMDLELRNPNRYGFEADAVPIINFQTSVSSRVFGDIRR